MENAAASEIVIHIPEYAMTAHPRVARYPAK